MTTANHTGPALGELLRRWRRHRGLSQMKLAHRVGISPRHQSFIETGRSRPSREVLERIARELEVPLREENVLLETAGYARRYPESSLDDPGMDRVRRVFAFLLERHRPYSALVMDRDWDILMANEPHRTIVSIPHRGPGTPGGRRRQRAQADVPSPGTAPLHRQLRRGRRRHAPPGGGRARGATECATPRRTPRRDPRVRTDSETGPGSQGRDPPRAGPASAGSARGDEEVRRG